MRKFNSPAFQGIVAGLSLGALVGLLLETARFQPDIAIQNPYLIIIESVFASVFGYFIHDLSLLLIKRLGQISTCHRIVAMIPVLNIVMATWLFLSTRDAIEIARAKWMNPMQNVISPSKTPSGQLVANLGRPTLDSPESEDPERPAMKLGSKLTDKRGAGVARLRCTSSMWTFMAGAGSVLEIFPPPERIDNEQTVAEALANDWQVVAEDLWAAIDCYEASFPSVGRTKQIPARSAMTGRAQRSPNADWPTPDILEAYEKAVPCSAKAILDDFLNRSERRLAMEQQSLSARISIARWGQVFGFVIGMSGLIAGGFSAYHGQQIAASFIGAGGVVGLVSVFVLGRMKLGETTVEK